MAACTKLWKTACNAARAEARGRRNACPRGTGSARGTVFPTFFSLLLFLTGAYFPSPAAADPGDAEQARISAEVFEHKAIEHFYSAEFREAEALYKKAIELQAENPLYWNSLADCHLFQLLLAAGRLDSQFYTAANEFLIPSPAPADAGTVKAFWAALARARSLAEQRTRANAGDAQAHYALAVNYAIEANYHLNIAKKPLDALRVSGRARDAALRARQIDPAHHDANLILGGYEYAIGSVPGAFRWLLALGGHSGSKARGVVLIQDALLHGRRTSTAALALLAVLYGREKLFVYSREMFQHLARFFPRNYLYELEIARTYQRESNLGAAVEVCKSVARKLEAGAPGYARVDGVKLYFQIGALLEDHGKPEAALAYYEKAAGGNPLSALHGQSYLRMGDAYRKLGRTEKARDMYRKAETLPFPEIRKQAAGRLRGLK